MGSLTDGTYPGPGVALVGGVLLVSGTTQGNTTAASVGCFNPASNHVCSGTWPVDISNISYIDTNGDPFPLLDPTGNTTGFCLPTGSDPCWSMSGASVATPAGMATAIPGTSPYNGQAVVLGPRVYVPNGNNDEVDCYDASTDASCTNFPRAASGAGYLYTVNADPQRPTCLWTNADNGTAQIQNLGLPPVRLTPCL